MDRRPFVIDTDTASDDAVALVMALRYPDIDVHAITVVAGNVPLDQAVQNALYTVELCDADVPVYAGADQPLVYPLETAQNVHGNDGMGDIGLPLHGRRPTDGDAVEVLCALAARFAGELTLVTLGPVTNVALALRRQPEMAKHVKRCVVMGAVADHIGNVTPVAEFNMYVDPHAMAEVLASGMQLEFVGWDISRTYAVFDEREAAAVRALGTPLAQFCVDIQGAVADFAATETKLAGFDLPDPIAMAYALDPAVGIDVRRLFVQVECDSPITRGMVVMDTLGFMHRAPNATVVMRADGERFRSMLRRAVASS
jgi:purine nucleosidase